MSKTSLLTKTQSKGIYSLEKGWLKEPEAMDIPDIDENEISKLAKPFEERADKILENGTVEDINKLIDDIYLERQTSILKDGEFGKGNLVFKLLRSLGILQDLKDKKVELENREMSIEESSMEDKFNENLEKFFIEEDFDEEDNRYFDLQPGQIYNLGPNHKYVINSVDGDIVKGYEIEDDEEYDFEEDYYNLQAMLFEYDAKLDESCKKEEAVEEEPIKEEAEEVQNGFIFKFPDVRDTLQVYLDWEGIYGYTDDIIDFGMESDSDDLEDYLAEEGIYGYTYAINNILDGESAFCKDMTREDFEDICRSEYIDSSEATKDTYPSLAEGNDASDESLKEEYIVYSDDYLENGKRTYVADLGDGYTSNGADKAEAKIFNSEKEAQDWIDEINSEYDNNPDLTRFTYGIEKLESLDEDTVKQNGKWVNKGKEGTHGKFKTKKEADAQRKAMFASGYKGESLGEDVSLDDSWIINIEYLSDNGISAKEIEKEFPELKFNFKGQTFEVEGNKEAIDKLRKRLNLVEDVSVGQSYYLKFDSKEEADKAEEIVKSKGLVPDRMSDKLMKVIGNEAGDDATKAILDELGLAYELHEDKISGGTEARNKEQINLPAYSVEYISGYAGNGVNQVEHEYFRTKEEQEQFVKELEENGAQGVKTYTIDNFYHTEADESLNENNPQWPKEIGSEYDWPDKDDDDEPRILPPNADDDDYDDEFDESLNEGKDDIDDNAYYVLHTGGSIGQKRPSYSGPFDSIEQAKEKAKSYRKYLTPGERKYYHMGCKVIQGSKLKKMFNESLNEDVEFNVGDKFVDESGEIIVIDELRDNGYIGYTIMKDGEVETMATGEGDLIDHHLAGNSNIMKDILDGGNYTKVNEELNEAVDPEDPKAQALANFEEVDISDISQDNPYDSNLYSVGHSLDYLICTKDEAYNEAVNEIKALYDDIGLDSFTPRFKEWILDNAVDDDFIDEFVDNEIDYFTNDEPDSNMVDYLEGLTDKLQYVKDTLGPDTFEEAVKDHIDLDKVAEEAISEDGVAHFIAQYDENEIDLGNGLYAYRVN